MSDEIVWLVALAALLGTRPCACRTRRRCGECGHAIGRDLRDPILDRRAARATSRTKTSRRRSTSCRTASEITERLLNGASQFSIVGPDAVLIDATKGGPLRILAGIVRKPPLFLIAKSSIKTFADLRGANIGALSLTEGSSKLLIKMAKAEGLAAAT